MFVIFTFFNVFSAVFFSFDFSASFSTLFSSVFAFSSSFCFFSFSSCKELLFKKIAMSVYAYKFSIVKLVCELVLFFESQLLKKTILSIENTVFSFFLKMMQHHFQNFSYALICYKLD